MFNYMGMLGDYEDRMVDRYEEDDLIISTARVTDGVKTFETAVQHPNYNDNKWVIVENYDTREEAQAGHGRWVKAMTSENPPAALEDCMNASIMQLWKLVGGEDLIYEKGE